MSWVIRASTAQTPSEGASEIAGPAWEEEVAQAFGDAEPARPDATPDRSPSILASEKSVAASPESELYQWDEDPDQYSIQPAAPPPRPPPPPPPSPPTPSGDLTESAARPVTRRTTRGPVELEKFRNLVGIAAIAYGAIATLVLVGWTIWYFPEGFISDLFYVALGVAIVVGGALILRRDRNGPAWAALASLFLCFFPAWWLFLSLLALATVGAFGAFALEFGQFVVCYSIPLAVTYWCLRYEMAKQEEEQEDER